MDIAGFTQKVVSLEAELQDISSQESKDEASLAKVKKQLRDLEAKVKGQVPGTEGNERRGPNLGWEAGEVALEV